MKNQSLILLLFTCLSPYAVGATPQLFTINDTYAPDNNFTITLNPVQAGKCTPSSTQQSCEMTASATITVTNPAGISCELAYDFATNSGSNKTCHGLSPSTGSTISFNGIFGINSNIVSWGIYFPSREAAQLSLQSSSPSKLCVLNSKEHFYTCNIPNDLGKDSAVTFKDKDSKKTCTLTFNSIAQGVTFSQHCASATEGVYKAATKSTPNLNTLTFSAGMFSSPKWLTFFGTPHPTKVTFSSSSNTAPAPCHIDGSNGSCELKEDLSLYNNLKTSFAGASEQCSIQFYSGLISDNGSNCQSYTFDIPSQSLTFSAETLFTPLTTVTKPTQLPSPLGYRTITFENECDKDIWFSLDAGTASDWKPPPAKPLKGTGTSCTITDGKNTTCPVGTTCRYTTKDTGSCFFDLPLPYDHNGNQFTSSDINAYHLPANAGSKKSKSVKIPIYDHQIIFSGGASARLGCLDATGNPNNCAIGNCNPSNNQLGCYYTQGTSDGASIAEFTFQKTNPSYTVTDYYDISLINGVHIPISMAPTPLQNLLSADPGGGISSQYYWCKEAGRSVYNPKDDGGAPPCSWNFIPPSQSKAELLHQAGEEGLPLFINVSPPIASSKSCTKQSDCTIPGQACGTSLTWLSNGAEGWGKEKKETLSALYFCGKFLGFDPAANLCVYFTQNPSLKHLAGVAPLHCNRPVGSNTLTNLYSCNGQTNNCVSGNAVYTNGVVCCGCSLWNDEPIYYPNAIAAPGCSHNKNPLGNRHWNKYVKPPVEFIKNGCPRAYSYQFDDATSTYQCRTSPKTNINTTNYTIRFCPDGAKIEAPTFCQLNLPENLISHSQSGSTLFSWQAPVNIKPASCATTTVPDSEKTQYLLTLHYTEKGHTVSFYQKAVTGLTHSVKNAIITAAVPEGGSYTATLSLTAPGFTSSTQYLQSLQRPSAEGCKKPIAPYSYEISTHTSTTATLIFPPAFCEKEKDIAFTYALDGLPSTVISSTPILGNIMVTINLSNLKPSTLYSGTIIATETAHGQTATTPFNFTTLAATHCKNPTPASGFTTPILTSKEATLSWKTPASCTGIKDVVFTYALSGLPPSVTTPIPTLGEDNVISTNLSNLKASTLYTGTLIATETAHSKTISTPFTFTTPAATCTSPTTPASFAKTHLTSTGVTLSWTPASCPNGLPSSVTVDAFSLLEGRIQTSLSNLKPSTPYSGTLISTETANGQTTSTPFDFKTPASHSKGTITSCRQENTTMYLTLSTPQAISGCSKASYVDGATQHPTPTPGPYDSATQTQTIAVSPVYLMPFNGAPLSMTCDGHTMITTLCK
jgi:hypothetical protein